MMSSFSPFGATSDSMSVTKPYLYSLVDQALDGRAHEFSWADLNRTWYSQALQPLSMCSRRSTSAPSTSAEEPRLRGADLGKPLGHRGNGAVVFGQRAASAAAGA